MLVELRIENFAIIDQLELHLENNLVIFTGETGAGKSIIVDALESLVGGRADSTLVRGGAERTHVEGVFKIPPEVQKPIHDLLLPEDLLDDPEWVTLAREIRQNGRNIARVNGRSVNTSLLRQIGEILVDLHGQSEHLSLLRVNQHIELLDRFAFGENSDPDSQQTSSANLRAYQEIYYQLRASTKELAGLLLAERDAARRTDTLTYQIQEIENARLRTGEDNELKEERNRLANAEGLASLSQEALLTLDEGTPESQSVTDLFGLIERSLTSLVRIDPTQVGLLENAQVVSENLRDLARDLRGYLEGIEFNPRRLDQVEDRLELIHILERKYGDSIPAIIEFANRARGELDTITHAGERITELRTLQEILLQKLSLAGQELSRKRKSVAEALSRAIETELGDLHMSGARFTVDFQYQNDPEGVADETGKRLAYNPKGLERVEFLIAPNPGEGFKPLVKIASGGETSRLMLALKNVLAKADQIPTLIFDEIDQGIGGRVGAVVGEKLWSLARQHQVLCITHLPQLAVFGGQHFSVQKQVVNDRTSTQVKALVGQERLVELAQMMGEVSEGTLRSARELILLAQKRTGLPPTPTMETSLSKAKGKPSSQA